MLAFSALALRCSASILLRTASASSTSAWWVLGSEPLTDSMTTTFAKDRRQTILDSTSDRLWQAGALGGGNHVLECNGLLLELLGTEGPHSFARGSRL